MVSNSKDSKEINNIHKASKEVFLLQTQDSSHNSHLASLKQVSEHFPNNSHSLQVSVRPYIFPLKKVLNENLL